MSVPSHPASSSSAGHILDEVVLSTASDLPVVGDQDPEDEDDLDDEDEDESPATTSAAAAAGEGSAAKKNKKKKKKSKAKKAVDALKQAMPGNKDIPDAIMDRVMEEVGKLPEGQDKDQLNEDEVRKGLQAMKLMDFLKSGDSTRLDVGGAGTKKDLGEHKACPIFWKTQPVIQTKDAGQAVVDGPIDPPKTQADIRQTPYPLPKDFVWETINVEDPEQIKELYELLTYNYVEDQEATMRFNYSAEFLDWALKPPGYVKEWQVGVRVKSTGKLVAFISGIPVNLRARSSMLNASEINFLVVHKKLRSKRLAPVLIKEVTRRCNLHGVFQAVYTAGVVLPTPVAVSRYYHRSLNVSKLIDIGFAYVPRTTTRARYVKQYDLPPTPSTVGWREMEARDLDQVGALLKRYLGGFELAPEYGVEEVGHWFLSGRGKGEVGEGGKGRRREQVTWVFVVEDSEGKITDMISFYSLPSSILNNPQHDLLNAAYTFYYATSAGFLEEGGESSSGVAGESARKDKKEERLRGLMRDLLIQAKAADFDVMNSLTMLDNNSFLADQKFGAGDGYLNYYLYNWRTSQMSGGFPDDRSGTSGIGLVML